MSRHRVGVDIGGTFTDFTVEDETGNPPLGLKVPTVPDDPVGGVLHGLDILGREHAVAPADVGYFVHGTTIAVNTLIERKGAALGLLVTRGFRDLLLIQRLRIPNPQNWFGDRPAPLVRRRDVWEVTERLRADGSVHTTLAPDTVRTAARQARERGLAGLVICFLHAFRNAEHEREAQRIIAESDSPLFVCCSHAVWPRMREYERAIIALVNAYVTPRVEGYLTHLEERLGAAGMRSIPYITRSNGGVMTARRARHAPAETLLSGPAAGVMGAVTVARANDVANFISLDVGGTSADVAIIENGQPQTSQSEHIADFPLMMPVVGVSSIGAGGGSIARIAEGGVLEVGPGSAGSDPGPACYGRGNAQPTVTDAFLAGGYLDPTGFASGRFRLESAAAERSLAPIVSGLGRTLAETAEAVLDIAVAATWAELSNLAAKRGASLRDYAMVAFGGAGPLLACRVAEEAGIDSILVPHAPGMLCARGALACDIIGDFVKSVLAPLDTCAAVLPEIIAALERDARDWVETDASEVDAVTLTVSGDMRYAGQSFEIDVALDINAVRGGDVAAVAAAFHAAYERVFAHADHAATVEVIDIRLRAAGALRTPVRGPVADTSSHAATPAGERTVSIAGKLTVVPTWQRDGLATGQCIAGPALIDQADTTVWIAPAWQGVVRGEGTLVLTRDAS